MKRCYICRGLPGSGKSFRARHLASTYNNLGYKVVVCSNDDYFMKDGVYQWKQDDALFAKLACQDKFMAALAEGVEVVIVDNTHLTAQSCYFYVKNAFEQGYQIIIIEMPLLSDEDHLKRNIHGVPLEHIQSMRKAWQPDLTVEKILVIPQNTP